MYTKTTRNIEIKVEPSFLEEQSSPEENLYAWAYHVQISNKGSESVQLRTRYWHITDKLGRIQEVRGVGVIGEQPVLKPGESYAYTSGAHLPTESGIMAGCYQMETPGGEMFNVSIPTFSLDSPHEIRSLQ